MAEWTALIRDVGFPIALVVYLMVRFDKLLRDVRDALRELVAELKHHHHESP